MSGRKRDRQRVSNDGGSNRNSGGNRSGGKGSRGGNSGGSSGSSKKRNRARGNRNRRSGSRKSGAGFWGDPATLPEPQSDVRITDDPSAVARSLGPAPLPGHEQIAQKYFELVYDRAVTMAGALAAAGGLIDPDALAEELAD